MKFSYLKIPYLGCNSRSSVARPLPQDNKATCFFCYLAVGSTNSCHCIQVFGPVPDRRSSDISFDSRSTKASSFCSDLSIWALRVATSAISSYKRFSVYSLSLGQERDLINLYFQTTVFTVYIMHSHLYG